ncbi:MAG: hypothetical protein JW861_09115, partial [Bacteroidales bacterium]|nr:hypothetical protein [Bacteroidales bacterium]
MMSRTSLILTIVLTLAGAWISDAQVDFTYQITGPRINPAGEYQLLLLDNTMPDGRVGEPVLPYHSISLILPPGHIADRMEIITGQFVELPGTYRLAPAQASRPLSSTGTPHWEIHTGVYSQDGPYPSQPEGKIITQFLNGYSIALSTFTPAVYYPSSGKLGYYQTITVRIFTRLAQDAVSALSNLKDSRQIRDRLGRLAQNPEAVASYPAQDPGSDDYELLIITPNQFSSGFQSLADLYLRRGMRTAITTVEEIQTGGTGQDLQEKIRNHIIQEYQDHGIGFVLLGGDVEYVPYRGFYCKVISSSVYEDDDIPADLYYGALDGTWNDDGDNLWGEPGEDDLLPELGVGRFPVSNTTELNNVVHKSESYQDTPVTGELRDPLLAGEHLWSDPPTWGSDYLELLIGYHDDNGYTTTGIPEDHNIDKLYEEIQPWGASDLIAKINQGKSFLHHSGHANETYVAFLSNSDITNSNFNLANGTDHNYTLMFSHGCYCGSFDYNDCIMERMVNIENFAVSVIGNSRYGWFNEGQTEGPAAHMHREYADALYHEKIGCLGDAFAEMKIQTAPWVTAPGQWEEGALRWNFYDINILGNPALAVWADEPITIQVNYQAAIPIGVPSTQVTVTSNGSPVEGLTCALLKDGTLHGAALTGSNGTAVIQLDPAFTQVGDAELVVSGYNCLPTQYPVTVIPNAGAYVIYSSHQIDDSQGNGNGQVDFGETIGLTVEIENVGSQQASNVAVQLSTSDAYITITDGFESYGNIPAG